MKTQEQEQEALARAAVERSAEDLRRAETEGELLDDDLGEDDLLETHGHKISSTDDYPGRFWDEQRNREQGLTVILISRRPTAGETGSGYFLAIEKPLALLGSHEELARAVELYPSSSPEDRPRLRQKIWRLVMGPDYAKPATAPGDNFVAFLIYIWGQSPVGVRMPTQN